MKTPGVYIGELDGFSGAIPHVPTSLPAFIGYTEKAIDSSGRSVHCRPTMIRSITEYEDVFGTAQNETGILVNIDAAGAAIASMESTSQFKMHYAIQLYFIQGGGECYIQSVGNYADSINLAELQEGLNQINNIEEPTLLLFPDAVSLKTSEDYNQLMFLSLRSCAQRFRFTIIDTFGDDATAIDNLRAGLMDQDILKYGAAYYPYLKTSFRYAYKNEDVSVIKEGGPAVQLSEFLKNNPDLRQTIENALSKLNVIMPPSSAMAGVYRKVDNQSGVWKAPANIELNGVEKPTVQISNSAQENMNMPLDGKAVNAIRSFTGRGTLVWGARTLDGNSNDWRYISVRRLYSFIDASIRNGIHGFIFEENDAGSWNGIKYRIESFLSGLWRQGALAGSKPSQAYNVHVGLGTTMTSEDLLNNRMIIYVAIAPIRPAEFIVLEIVLRMHEY